MESEKEGFLMANKSKEKEPVVIHYLTLRAGIGVLGIAFPFVLSLGALIISRIGIRETLSSYYHTCMGDVFVGTLCVIGFFLFSYKGYGGSKDNIAGNLGCIFAVGVALFPVNPGGAAASGYPFIGYLHYIFAILLFITLIYFSLFLFTKTNPEKTPTKRKLQRNKVYKACGLIMSFCILLIAISKILPDAIMSSLEALNPVYWLETVCILAFGVSWFVKGETILKDKA